MTMRIQTTDLIAGQSAPRVRDFVRSIQPGHFITAAGVEEFFHVGPTVAKRLVEALVTEGYLEPVAHRPHLWQQGPRGPALASATAAPPIRRATADRMLAEIVARAKASWTEDYPLAYRVGQLLVFGSYLRDVPSINDLDLAIRWQRRFADRDAQHAFNRQRISAAHADGRVFHNVTQEMTYPWYESRRYLVGRLRLVSLHDLGDPDEHEFVMSVPHRELFHRPESD